MAMSEYKRGDMGFTNYKQLKIKKKQGQKTTWPHALNKPA